MQTNSGPSAKNIATKERHGVWTPPVLFPGSLGSATLVENHEGSLSWEFAVRPQKRPCLEARAKLRKVFADSRPPPIEQSSLSLAQRAEQGAQFLRTYHPDVDVPFDLIYAELDNAAAYPQSDHVFGGFDPLIGERLVITDDPRLQVQSDSAAVMFPSGEVGQNLNISVFTRGGQDPMSRPASPAMNFSTEIMQISLSSYTSPSSTRYIGSPLLAVRTLASLSFLKFHRPSRGLEVSIPYKIAELRWEALGGGPNSVVTDVALSPFEANASLIVTTGGSAHRIYVAQQGLSTEPLVLNPSNLSGFEQESTFWRIAWGDSQSSTFLAGEHCVKHLDLRQPLSSEMDIFRLDSTDPPDLITAIQSAPLGPSPHLLCVTSTDRVVWIDTRFPRQSVLTWRHKRAVDRTLKATTASIDGAPMTFLTSNINALVSLYDVRQEADGEIFSYGDPYEPRLSFRTNTARTPFLRSGFALLPRSHGSQSIGGGQGAVLDWFELSSSGAIFHQELYYTDPARSPEESREENVPFAEATDLDTRRVTPNVADPVADREGIVVNLSGLYNSILQGDDVSAELEVNLDNNGEHHEEQRIAEVLGGMPRVWQDSDEPLEHPLTTFDLAFRAGAEPLRPSRADFLNGSALRYDLLQRSRIRPIPLDDIVQGSTWSFDMTPLMQKLDDEFLTPASDPFPSRPSALLSSESFAGFNCLPGFRDAADDSLHYATATAASSKREKDAVEALALDLSLSRHMFAIRRPAPPQEVHPEAGADEDVADALSHATQSLSIAAKEPPAARFGYFRPRFMGSNDTPKASKDREQPLGVRLLLSEWPLAVSVDSYRYTDPYDSGADHASNVQFSQSRHSRSRQPVPASSQRLAPAAVTTISSQPPARLPPTLQSFAPPPQATASSIPRTYPASQQPFSRVHTSGSQALPRERRWMGEGFASQDPGYGLDMDIDADEAEPMTSTQILPGRYGGRPVDLSGKKKVVKRRVGGF
ncbi:hypothetical protein BS47DRAFT_1335765 [Hydnum rufescens UP504]|uniref:Uncharacterized protein n=1 Tax=Hydnum rufescens UP504 TaxID=1448309 RepID=A0A9P6BA87_9AGAM|nr:hypothetical protein BS47DRAFT_1335765 [Hydnum rufescens UP504]